VKGENMAAKDKSTDENYVCMYYEHQYDRIAMQEKYRLTMTNYVLTVSALAFTFGYQNASQLTVINGLGLPLIIVVANIFAILTINRTAEYFKAHQQRAHKILEDFAPALKKINNDIIWKKRKFLGGRQSIQNGLHVLLILTALIPFCIYLAQLMR
jgi:hypothetical protein